MSIPGPSSNYVQAFNLDIGISDTMGHFKKKAGEALHVDLSSYSVWILSQIKLDDNSTLQDLCGAHSGGIHIIFVLRSSETICDSKIDIIDVLKPNQENVEENIISNEDVENSSKKVTRTTKWIASPAFKMIQKKNHIPLNVEDWSELQVSLWIAWAKNEFKLTSLNPNNLPLDGNVLVKLTKEQLKKFAPHDPHNVFCMHFELLRRTQIVATLLEFSSPESNSSVNKMFHSDVVEEDQEHHPQPASRPSQNHLWYFLLELLIDHHASNLISWVGKSGEFKFHQPEVVAKMWGERKGKGNMTYNKLSRSLRYYYESEMNILNKVPDKKFSYKFEIDFKSILGYSPQDIQDQMEYARTQHDPT